LSVCFEFSGNLGEVYAEMRAVLGSPDTDLAHMLEGMALQELLAITAGRCAREGYTMEVRKDGDLDQARDTTPPRRRPRADRPARGTPTDVG
jgi:hypothetical protein